MAGPRRRIPVPSVGAFVPKLTRKAFEKYGFSTATLITEWPTIVGTEMAAWTAPERLKWPRLAEDADGGEPARSRSRATLVLRVDQARALDVQYKARQIIERINAYFGYAAVSEIRIIQGPVVQHTEPGPSPKAVLKRQMAREAGGTASEPLGAALARLGAAIRAGQ